MTADTVLYLYGFVRAPLDAGALAAAGPDVFLTEEGDIACAASLVPASDYHIPPDTNTAAQQLEWVAPRAWRHHDVLRHLHAAAAVVPLKFGTLCPDAEHARGMLRRLRDPIVDLLAGLDGRDEWTLNLHADVELLGAVIRHSDPQLAALVHDADALPEGRAYFARKKLHKATTAAVEARLAAVTTDVRERLSSAGIALADDRTPPAAGAAAAASLLVERSRFHECEALLTALESAHADTHVTFELVGPWPPYSFVSSVAGELHVGVTTGDERQSGVKVGTSLAAASHLSRT
jgi:hypothetical protein